MNPENLHARGYTVGWPHDSRIELDDDIDAALDRLRLAFPGLCIWWGDYCGSLWALLPDRLVEAKNSAQLARRLHAALAPPRPVEGAGHGTPVPRPSARRHDGTWTAPPRPAPHHEAVLPRRDGERPGLLTRLRAACRRLLHGDEQPGRHARPAHRRPGRPMADEHPGPGGVADRGSHARPQGVPARRRYRPHPLTRDTAMGTSGSSTTTG